MVVNSWGLAAQRETGAVWVSAPFSPSSSSLLLGGISAFPKGPLQSPPGQMPPGNTAAPGRWRAGVAGAVSPASVLDPAAVLGCCRASPRLACPTLLQCPRSQQLAPLPRSAEWLHLCWPGCRGGARGANIKGLWEQGVCGEERAGDPAAVGDSLKGA